MSASGEKTRLRLLTYMCPEVPVDVFTLLRDCVEEFTGLETDLIIENRFPGPPADRANPFTSDFADLVVMHSTEFLRLKSQGQTDMELCAAAPVHKHPLAADRPVYFSEIIIHSANKEKFKTVLDLKGCSWAYNNESSLSGSLVVLNYLKKELKTNANYFGSIIQSGAHINSIKMIRDQRVQAAAVDSTVLAGYLREHEDHAEMFSSLVSLGPLPIYPLVFNIRLPAALKAKINDGLLSLVKSAEWAARLNDVGIVRFVPVDSSLYNLEEDIQQGSKGMVVNTTYY